jgi:carbonic anhydrase
MDTGDATQGTVGILEDGLALSNESGLGSCKFRGESYLCVGLIVNHPSHHKINGIQADGEVIAIFYKPTGGFLLVSSLFKVSSEQTPSYSFFKQFVPYAVTTGETKVMLKDWSIASMVAPGGYFVYQGSSITPPCTPCEWVVFKQMINMDQGDFAYLVRNVEAGSRPIQAIGDREVFFNNTDNSGPMPHDNKFYLRLRPTGNTRIGKPLEAKTVDLKSNIEQSKADAEEEAKNPTTYVGEVKKTFSDYIDQNGNIGLILAIVSVVGVITAIIYGWRGSNQTPLTGESMKPLAIRTRETLWWLYNYVLGFFGWLWSYIGGVFTWLYNSTFGLITTAFGILPGLVSKVENVATDIVKNAESKIEAKVKERAEKGLNSLASNIPKPIAKPVSLPR